MARAKTSGPSTRDRLIETAERLFAVGGISGVSLREVGAAAGQRNTSAAHYYFGDKSELVRAIFEYRMRDINAQRRRMLADLEANPRADRLRALLEALVFPLAAHIVEGGHYARFFAQLTADPDSRRRVYRFDWAQTEGLNDVWEAISTLMEGTLPPEVLRNRLRMLRTLVVTTSADMEERGATAEHGTPQPWALDLVDAAEGLLTAPCRAVAPAAEERGGATA
ncbi:TetR/AcrR family transcriptional regulator [Streptomonospora litoralis]|uniref:HTH-type transcriptional regulator AcrR n=1 Tax=Streptomonospora litoralis TaxID=2498135 RepID=A0A4P6PW73_9ACTN|nr:TetR/AcrR family transcriptional regulator [Streptomonospora litoralis]QBI51870.1 HTH-type transcriptional regulator AcrR [Streptomonospora litoralis]